MTKEKFKIIKDFGNPKKSERRKYLETMMADMGLTSLDELYSDEERRRWIKAVTPHPNVEKKLKEMGYSIFSNTNKPSLGSTDRSSDMHRIYKIANISAATDTLMASMRTIKSKLMPDTTYKIMEVLTERRLQSKDFDSTATQSEVEAVVSEHEENSDFFKFFIEDLIEKASKYNSEYLRSTEAFEIPNIRSMIEAMKSDSNLEIKRRHANRDQVAIIQQKLEDLNYNLKEYGVDGKFGPETESAVILFQQEHDLVPSGIVDYRTFNILLITKASHVEKAPEFVRGAVRLGGLTNVKFVYPDRIDIANATPMLHEYLKILNEVASDAGGTIEITSVFRDSYNQARIMLDNYNRRGGGSNRANRYLSRLYRRLPRIDEIVDVYASSMTRDEKINSAKNIIEASWSKTGHRGGKAIDVRLGRKVRRILKRTQDLATVDILRESDHFHVSVKSLSTDTARRSRIRRFRG